MLKKIPHFLDAFLQSKGLLPLNFQGQAPALHIRELKNNQITIDNFYLGLNVEAESSLIRWGGSEACLLTCRETRK